ncbi:MAG: InlB B-repeat-containing protein, partial [Muribaculaceae bacterium]|nr:InlB B-repeat-containing protein [Muribaculaceae bacterium]
IGALADEDCFYETASNGTGDSVSLLAAYHYVVNGFDFVVLNTGKNFFASASDYTYSEESVTWVSNKLAQICSTDKNKTIFFLVHIPFYDSNSISDVEKAMNTGSSSPAVETLKTTLAQYPNLVMLYGHDHGKDMAYIRENTEQRVTEYATDGNRYTSYCIQNYNNKDQYLGYNSFNLATTSEACDVAITPSVVTEGAFVFYLTTTIKNQRNYINYINCGSSGRFSGNNGHTTENQQIKLFEVENPDETTITATQATSIVPGKTYMLVGVKEGNYYALTNEMYQNNTTNQRMVGAAVTIADGTITYTPGTASVLWTIKEKSPAAEKSFISSFMGSMRYYNNSFEDGQINPRRIIQALMVYVYSDRVELKMKNYGEGDVTSNGITVKQDLAPYISYRTVTHSEEAVTATPTITSTGGDVAPNTVVTVTVDAPEWHKLYYTTDGTEPTEKSSTVEGREFTFTPSTTGKVTVKVAAQEGIRLISASDSVTYTVVDTHGITVSTNGEGGTAEFSIEGDNVILTASPKEGYDFVNWTMNGNVVATTAEATIAYTEDAQYVANFAKQTFTVIVTATEGGSVNTITDPVEYGTTLTLTATPNDGYQFVNWTLNGEPVSENATYTTPAITANVEYVANFEVIPALSPEEIYAAIDKPTVSYGNVMQVTGVNIENVVRGATATSISLDNVPLNVSGTHSRHKGATDAVTIYTGAEFDLKLTLDATPWFGMQFYQIHNSIDNIVANYGFYGPETTCSPTVFWSEVSADTRVKSDNSNSTLTFHIALSDDVKAGDVVVFRALSALNEQNLASLNPAGTYSQGAYLDIFFVVAEPPVRTVKIATNDKALGYAGYVTPQPEGTALDVTTS